MFVQKQEQQRGIPRLHRETRGFEHADGRLRKGCAKADNEGEDQDHRQHCFLRQHDPTDFAQGHETEDSPSMKSASPRITTPMPSATTVALATGMPSTTIWNNTR